MSFSGECPPSLKQIQHYLKVASEHEARNSVVCYWSEFYALQTAIPLKANDNKAFLLAMMDHLEMRKKQLSDNEAITNDVVAQAHIENYALKLFTWADTQDRQANFGKNVVKAFYTAGMLFDVLTIFGELSEEVQQNRKYAKWKAAYIHNCLKNGERPVPGPMKQDGESDEDLAPSDSAADGPGEPAPNGIPPTSPSIGFQAPSEPPPLLPPFHSPQPPQPPQPTELPSVPQFQPFPQPPFQPSPSSYTFPDQPSPQPRAFPSNFPQPQPEPSAVPSSLEHPSQSDLKLSSEQMAKAQKYCKYAGSALNYDDVPTAISYLEKALRLCKTGVDS